MYLRHTTVRKNGKVQRYWRLVRSVRVGRRVIQQTVAHLGELDGRGRIEARALARHLIGSPEQAQLFDDVSEHLTVPVRLKGIAIERSRQFGDVYLALALWRGIGLEAFCERLLPVGQERIAWAKMATVLVATRFCEPSSELHIAEDWYRRTALCDLLQLGDEQITKDRLYRGLDHLLAHKAALEAHLSQRCGELFAVTNEVLLYDVTSTYFEGQADGNAQAQRGYSRDHRPDCKQVLIALVVTFDGFPLGYEVFAGNTHDSRTLQTIVATMESRHGERREPGVAARHRSALHHRRAQVGAQEVRRRACGCGRVAHGPGRRGGQTHAPSRHQRDRDPVPFGRSAQQREGDARQVQRPHRSGAATPRRSGCARKEAARSSESEPADRPHPAAEPACRGTLCHCVGAGRLAGSFPHQRDLQPRLRRLGRALGVRLSVALQHQ